MLCEEMVRGAAEEGNGRALARQYNSRFGRLSPQERRVVRQRLLGRSYADIATDELLRKPDGRPISRARVHQLEIRAMRELAGRFGRVVTVASVVALQRLDRALDLRERAQLVTNAELRHDPAQVRARRPAPRDRIEEGLEALATRLIEQAERGGLSPWQMTRYAAEAERLAAGF
ncbi:MAG TPA: hypothetical protein VFB06_37715 [Streptosporangiaceae bacterium]|nr:hypothetical protein [Streptosporangiaceae bacterium]